MTGGMAELLIQSHTDVIRLLPALPAEWPDGSYHGLRARGGLSFDVAWSAGALTAATVTADHAGAFTISGPTSRAISVRLEAGETRDLTSELGG
ncbi:glycoside hydrolase family 95-like protein [Kribbella orskensis]